MEIEKSCIIDITQSHPSENMAVWNFETFLRGDFEHHVACKRWAIRIKRNVKTITFLTTYFPTSLENNRIYWPTYLHTCVTIWMALLPSGSFNIIIQSEALPTELSR